MNYNHLASEYLYKAMSKERIREVCLDTDFFDFFDRKYPSFSSELFENTLIVEEKDIFKYAFFSKSIVLRYNIFEKYRVCKDGSFSDFIESGRTEIQSVGVLNCDLNDEHLDLIKLNCLTTERDKFYFRYPLKKRIKLLLDDSANRLIAKGLSLSPMYDKIFDDYVNTNSKIIFSIVVKKCRKQVLPYLFANKLSSLEVYSRIINKRLSE